MKKLFLLILIVGGFQLLNAQQENHYTQFMYNRLLLNPAYAGARGVPFVTAIHRSQWLGFEGAPTGQSLSFNSKFLLDRAGIGLNLSHLKIGHQRDFYGALAYSYKLVTTDEFTLRLGLNASIRSFSLDFGDPNALNLPALPDQSIPNSAVKKILGNVGAGIYGTVKDKAYFGFSVPRIYSNILDDVNGIANIDSISYAKPHFYGMAGISLPIADKVALVPQILLKYVKNSPFDADLNATLEFDRKAGFGVSYRLGGDGRGESLDALLFLKMKDRYLVAVSYDFTLSQIKDYSSGSVEVMLQADLKASKNEMSNPRFFF